MKSGKRCFRWRPILGTPTSMAPIGTFQRCQNYWPWPKHAGPNWRADREGLMSKELPNRLPELLETFFCHRLPSQQAVSPHTLGSYRDTARLLLKFIEQK